MNGRIFFKKYARVIDNIVNVEKVFPASLRVKRLSALRNKNGSVAMLRRYILVKTLARKCGQNVAIFPGVYFENIENLSIGDNVSIHQMCYIDAEGEIEIGNNVSIAHRCTVLSSNHRYDDITKPIKYQGMTLKKTIIDDDVWLGCGTTVLGGCVINSGSVIGSNSTVTKNIAQNTVCVGSPCKEIKRREKK